MADLEGAGRGWPQGRMPARAGARLAAGGEQVGPCSATPPLPVPQVPEGGATGGSPGGTPPELAIAAAGASASAAATIMIAIATRAVTRSISKPRRQP